jgi:hypothetical protein
MRKNISQLLGLILMLSIVAGISYISVLGENDRATATVKAYFDNIAKKRYEANPQLGNDAYNRRFDNVNDPITHQFSLETALLNYFGLINTAQYTTETRRDEFWIPCSGNNILHVSVRIRPQGTDNVLTKFMNKSNARFLENLVTLVREDGRWKISDIDTRTSAIAKDYQSTKNSMQNSKYIQQTTKGLIIKENTIEFTTLDPIQKRIINFNLNKALTLLNAYE